MFDYGMSMAPEEPTEKSHVVGRFCSSSHTMVKLEHKPLEKKKRQFIQYCQDVCEGLHYILENNQVMLYMT